MSVGCHLFQFQLRVQKHNQNFQGKKVRKLSQQAERKEYSDRKSNRTRQKNKKRDSQVESNVSLEIPDKGEDI